MKHLKNYKIFESDDPMEFARNIYDLQNDINDIFFSEISDEDRFKVRVETTHGYNPQKRTSVTKKNWVSISLSDHMDFEGFRLGEIKDFLLRLKDYLGDRCGKVGILVQGETERIDIDINEKEIDQIDRWYNMIDTPGIANIFIRVL